MTETAYAEWHHSDFRWRYHDMLLRVQVLAERDPDGYKQHPDTRFFKGVRTAMDTALAAPPTPRYQLSVKTLRTCDSRWRRIKQQGLPHRYRLFFQFSSAELKVIFAWLNDERSLRRDGERNDVYAVFARLLKSGKIPGEFLTLLQQSTCADPS